MSTVHAERLRAKQGQPTWEAVPFLPPQGYWSEEEYLSLDGNRVVEFTDGYLEVLPMPTLSHQMIVLYLYRALLGFVEAGQLGKVVVAAYPVHVRPGAYREPDVVFFLAEHAARASEQFAEGADLVMEVVSPGGRERDLELKRDEYAAAGISEYWIVDPKLARITVLRLEGDHYAVHGEFKPGERASSALLSGFTVDVAAALAAK
jgi:Uma2 family endonuclease